MVPLPLYLKVGALIAINAQTLGQGGLRAEEAHGKQDEVGLKNARGARHLIRVGKV